VTDDDDNSDDIGNEHDVYGAVFVAKHPLYLMNVASALSGCRPSVQAI